MYFNLCVSVLIVLGLTACANTPALYDSRTPSQAVFDNKTPDLNAFVGSYTLFKAKGSGNGGCSKDIQITLDNTLSIVEHSGYGTNLDFSHPGCVDILKTNNQEARTDCTKVSLDEVQNSHITGMPLGRNIETRGIKFSNKSRSRITTYLKYNVYGATAMEKATLDLEPWVECEYNRN